jgi:hypothetical protein
LEPYLRQPRAPSQVPSFPQVSPAESWQSSCGSFPDKAGAQVPFGCAVSDCEQASQEPVHAVSQHTPSTQNPEAQSAFREQAAPI